MIFRRSPDIDHRSIRVMHVLPWVYSGGVETRRLELARHLDHDRFEQKIVSLRARGPLRSALEEESVQIATHNTKKRWHPLDFKGVRWVMRQIRKWEPDIIHGAVFEGVSMAALAGSLSRTPVIVLEETGDPSIRSWRGTVLLKGLSRLADACVGVSPPIGDYLRDELGLSASKVYQINNGVKPINKLSSEVSLEVRREWEIAPDSFVVGSVGRIHNSHKRFTDLIDAVALLAPELPRLHLLIVGSGRDLDLLKSHAEKLGISQRVTLTGYQYDVERYYSTMDAFALLSEQESFGLVVAEAMFCELPVVASRVGGMQHIVRDGETGFLVDSYAPEKAAEAIRKLYHSKECCERFGKAGRARAEKHYNSQRYAKEVEELYLKLLSQKASR